MEQTAREERSKQIWVFRSFAILSVCCAHMPMDAGTKLTDCFLNQILGILGTLGVGGFFLCSGYYFSAKEAVTIAYWKRKFWKLIVPWLLLGAATKVWYNYIAGTRPILHGYMPWILGRGTWMYFVPVLIELMIIFAIVRKLCGIYVLGILSIVSNVAVICGWGYGKYITPYMNPFNWAIFFVVGLIWQCQEEKLIQIYKNRKNLLWWMVSIIFATSTLCYFFLDIDAYYWTWVSLPFELSGIALLLLLAGKVRNYKLLQDIGKNTLFIFMTHMIIAGGVMNHMPATGIIAFLRPIVALFITYVGTLILRELLVICHVKQLIPILGMSRQ